jgi:hypothetical protein
MFYLNLRRKMTSKEYESFEEQLKANGYRKYTGAVINEDYYWCKGFEYVEDEDGDRRPSYQVIFSVWDYRNRPELRVPDFDKVGVAVRVIMSGDGRIDLELTQDKLDIEDVETKAHSFYEWVKENFKICE